MPFETGPHVQVAAFCEQVIEDKTGVLSLIRVIDTLTHTASGPEPPVEMPPWTYPLKLVLALKPDRARGRHGVKVVPEFPSGETKQPLELSMNLESEEKGSQIVANVAITFTLEGLYWFNIYFDGNLLTKVPLRVKYERLVTGRK